MFCTEFASTTLWLCVYRRDFGKSNTFDFIQFFVQLSKIRLVFET